MKIIRAFLLLVCWLMLSTLLTHWWISSPEPTPHLPLSVWMQLDKLYQSRNGEELADLEFFVSFIIVAVVIGLGYFTYRCLRCRRGSKNRNVNKQT